ncbi:hypothetical protein HDV00_000318, partial [Rhizophlyctis rosea]
PPMPEVLVYNLNDEHYLGPSEKGIRDVLSQEEYDQALIGKSYLLLAWALCEKKTWRDTDYMALYMIETLVKGRNSAMLLMDKVEKECPTSLGPLPHNPIPRAHEYWKKFLEAAVDHRSILPNASRTEWDEFTSKDLQWEGFDPFETDSESERVSSSMDDDTDSMEDD